MDDLPDIAPCPFCKGHAELMTHWDTPPDLLVVSCTACGARGPECGPDGMPFKTALEAVQAWNRCVSPMCHAHQ